MDVNPSLNRRETDKRKKRSPKKTKRLNKVGDEVDFTDYEDDEIVEAIVGKKVTFKRNLDDKKPKTYAVKSAKVMKKRSKKFGPVVQMKTGKEGAFSIPAAWITRVG